MDNAPVQEEPRDIEAEKAVLGAAFLSKNALADAMEYLEPQDFYLKFDWHIYVTKRLNWSRQLNLSLINFKVKLFL